MSSRLSNQVIRPAWILVLVLLGIASRPDIALASEAAFAPGCGDGACAGDENDTDCPQDCGCSAATDTCNDAVAPFGCFCDASCAAEGDCCSDVGICSPPTDGQGAEAICGGFGSKESGFFKKIQLRATKLDLRAIATAWDGLGWEEAADYLHHYLDGDGTERAVDVDKMIDELDSFEKKIKDTRIKLGEEAVAATIAAGIAARTDVPIAPTWCYDLSPDDQCGHSIGASEDLNWYLALRSWGFRHIGTIMVEPFGGQDPDIWNYTVQSQVLVQKIYNFDPDKNLVAIDFKKIAELHCYGWAQEFLVRGTSKPGTHTVIGGL